MKHRRAVLTLVAMLAVSACTSGPGDPTGTGPADASASTPPSPSSTEGPDPGAPMVRGTPLPAGCDAAAPKPAQTVTLVADGRMWAVAPMGRSPVCLFTTRQTEAIAWGPRADRVAFADLAVRGIGDDAFRYGRAVVAPQTFDWGHPQGLAIAYAEPHALPAKRFMDDGRTETLLEMPQGDYTQIVYHPSGLALGFILQRGDRSSIWISTNEGLDPTRLVFGREGTAFTSIAFTPDGTHLMWTADHAGDFSQIHSMDLADRTGFSSGWHTEQDQVAGHLVLPPSGDLMAVDEGATCAERRAMIVYSTKIALPAVPDEDRPTTVVGWVDDHTLVVSSVGCADEDVTVFVVDALSRDVAVLAEGVEVAATRAMAPPAPAAVPAPADEEAPPGGVG